MMPEMHSTLIMLSFVERNCVNNKDYVVWQVLANGIKSITENQTFNDIPLLLRADRGRVTRSRKSFACDKEGFRAIILQRFKGHRIYLDLVISELCNRFEPWPEWLVLGEKCLNFMNEWELEHRRQSKLLNTTTCHSSVAE